MYFETALTFFAAAKKVSAAPHRGNANRPLTNQGKAKRPKDQKTKNKTDHEPSKAPPKTHGNTQKIQLNNKNRQPGKKYQ
ncbi:hypothetical protein [Paraburkholderia fungorum]|uniref:hypothetical protein n=1 Tax=Paraburkholderia fungorum TaxID=134537 RepID=UPI0011EA61C9|nr:hypothetical protein [Paraburkholderia fungorum]